MDDRFTLTITRDPAQVRAAQALRHAVFVEELGGASPGPEGLEADAYDSRCDHLILTDRTRPDLGVVATLRLGYGAAYTETEFDLSKVRATGRLLAEPGRTCLHPDYRGGPTGMLLFRGMLDHLRRQGIGFLVGTASFHGADPAQHLPALRRLRQEALAPDPLRPVARGAGALTISGTAERGAMRQVPSLIKTYLRAGAWIGDGAWIDHAFNTVDVCVLLDMNHLRLPPDRRADLWQAARLDA